MRHGGFTLLEVLVVVAIISLLAGLIVPAVLKGPTKAHIVETQTLIEKIKIALEGYESAYGDYPPTSLRDEGYFSNSTNDGIESLLVHLASKARNEPMEVGEKYLDNTDKDEVPKSYPLNWYFGDSKAREIVDSWGNPLIYFHRNDYEAPKKYMRTYKLKGGKKITGVKPGKSKKTATYHGWSTYQIWSVGPNGKNENGEGDDITSWGS
jgi:prepilin-type N-terminal cleavage/methylation domain-containing protein